MPAPRPSQSAEAAQAAVLQAEFNEKKWVWVPDDKEGYLAGWVNKEDGDMGEIVMGAGGEIRKEPLYTLSKMNPPKFDRVDDIADLTFLNEASVVHNLRLRYGSGAIYTYSGLFLVAINPYQPLPLYSDAIVQQCRGKRRDENPPHIFAIAERAWVNMGDERENQSILITGESGAGKTESTKKVIQYLAAIATDVQPPTSPSHTRSPSLIGGSAAPPRGLPRSSSFRNRRMSASISGSGSGFLQAKDRLGLLERQILQANPILEAFGNAQTQRNNNSSRFGKFVRISFAPDGSIAGANIDWYLLEKSRVVKRSEAERSFHVFYQLLAGGGALKDSLLLDGGVADYDYLSKSRREVDGINDREEWNALQNALDIVGFSSAEQFELFRIVAAIMHIGNIEIASTRADDALMPDNSQAERVCHLLGLPVAEFTRAVLRPRVLAGREWVEQARTKQQALDELGALCKTLYEKSFGHLVDRINRALDRPSNKSTFIGVLDIAGFEIFEVNAYEQLLINYTNEKLQQFFNHHMFVLEQEEYAREGIEWSYVNFGLDLQPTIDLIEASGPKIGVLSCLDEECIMPKATDLTFTHKLKTMWSGEVEESEEPHPGRAKYEPARSDQGLTFVVHHYAGKVEYYTDGWLDKNKDPLNDNLVRVLSSSSERNVAALFDDFAERQTTVHSAILAAGGTTVGKKRGLKKGAFRTVGQRHKEQLSSLMAQLHATQPHFVRCIVPNGVKKPGRVDVPLVLDQLRCNGVLEGIRIARLGYPNRLPFVEFRQRYEVLTPGIIPRGYMDGRKACLRMVDVLELDKAIYRVGTSKIFFKAGVLAELEERRDALLYEIFSKLQAQARMWTARRQMKKILNRAVAIRTIQRNARVYGELRDWPWWQLYTKVRPLLAATRNDEELRKKEAELALVRERAERDQREREALETLKMSLEADKRKIEEELDAERALALHKDSLLARSAKRESELDEAVRTLEDEVDTLDSQLERALKLQRESEEKHETLRQAFDQAAEHLVRLEAEQQQSSSHESELAQRLASVEDELEMVRTNRDELQKLCEDLKDLAAQREEDLIRSKERMEIAVVELEGRVTAESSSRALFKSKSDALEQDVRQANVQVAELSRAATEYTVILQKKEKELATVSSELDAVKGERSLLSKQIAELQGRIDTLAAELDAQNEERVNDSAARTRLQEELDELRALLEAKTSENTRRLEVEKSKEAELSELRSQVGRLQADLGDSRRSGMEAQNKLRVDLDNTARELSGLRRSHDNALESEKSYRNQLAAVEASVLELEKVKRNLESEAQSLRARVLSADSQLDETTKAKDGLERHMFASQAKIQDLEEAVFQMERDKAASDRQLDGLQKELRAEASKRAHLEHVVSNQRAEIADLKERLANFDREMNKTLTDLKKREWEVKKLEARQDTTIVEHVHVLEEAKRVTDRQLKDAQEELKKMSVYVRSLEKTKNRMAGEAEDLVRVSERERLELRAQEREVQAREELAARAASDVENERRAREVAEQHNRKLQAELLNSHNVYAELSRRLSFVQESKDNLEHELARLADEGGLPESNHGLAQSPTARRSSRQQSGGPNGAVGGRAFPSDETRTPAKQVTSLKQHVQVLELRLVASDRVRKHLEKSMRELTAELERSDGSVQSLQRYRDRLTSENLKLAELLDEEAQARRAAEAAQVEGVQTMWSKFQQSLDEERETHQRSEDSRKALLIQQRTSAAEIDEQRKQLEQLSSSKQEMEARLFDMQSALELEQSGKAAILASNQKLEAQLCELQASSSSTSSIQSGLQSEMESYRAKAETYLARLKEAETARAKAVHSESLVREGLANMERLHSESCAGRKAAEEQLQRLRSQFHTLEVTLESNEQNTSDNVSIRQRLIDELDAERQQHQKDLDERDFSADQTRQKYQAELAQLSEELQAQRDVISRLRTENQKSRSDYDALQLRFDDEVYSGGAWKKEKDRMETKIADLAKAYEASTAAQGEQQAQIVALHSQVRELRGVLNDAEADRALLQKARRSLQAELETIKLDTVDTTKILSADRELQKLNLVKQDLERSLEEKNDRVAMALDRMKKAEAMATDCQVQLGKVRVENSELDKLNAHLEKHVKELNVRVVDLETKSYASSARQSLGSSRRLSSRIEELSGPYRSEPSGRTSPRSSKGSLDSQPTGGEWHRQRIDEERKEYESTILSLRDAMGKMQSQESELKLAKRRAEREAVESRQQATNLERELERLRNRIDRPSSHVPSGFHR